MEEKINKAIEALSEKLKDKVDENEALKYSQAVLNLANAKAQLQNVEKNK